MLDEPEERECENCSTTYTAEVKGQKLCSNCQSEMDDKALANMETPEGGWLKNSQADRL